MVAGLSQRLLCARFAVTTSVSSLGAAFAVVVPTVEEIHIARAESANDPRETVCSIIKPVNVYEYDNDNYYQIDLHMKVCCVQH